MAKKTWKERLVLPQQPFSQELLIELRGKRSVSIENHYGIREYTDTSVCVAVRRGTVRVCGAGLEIVCMTRRCVEICGEIAAVELE